MSLVHFITVHVLRQVFSGYFVCYFMTPDSEYRITGCRDTASISGSIRALIWCHSPATRLTAQTAARWHQLACILITESTQTFVQFCLSVFSCKLCIQIFSIIEPDSPFHISYFQAWPAADRGVWAVNHIKYGADWKNKKTPAGIPWKPDETWHRKI